MNRESVKLKICACKYSQSERWSLCEASRFKGLVILLKFCKIAGISFLNTSTCLATIFNFISSTPLLSNLRIPFPNITVKSGTISSSATSHKGPTLQCYKHQFSILLAYGIKRIFYLAQNRPPPNSCINLQHTPFPYIPCFYNSANLYHCSIPYPHPLFCLFFGIRIGLISNMTSF